MESWRQFLNESVEEEKYFGDWVSSVKAGEVPPQAVKFGSGGFRVVYQIPGDNDFVIKDTKQFAKFPSDVKQNKWEFQLQTLYPNLFPKVYVHSPDFKVMAVQKAKVLTDFWSADFDRMIKTNFPAAAAEFDYYNNKDLFKYIISMLPFAGKAMDEYTQEQLAVLKQDQKFNELAQYVANNRVDIHDIDKGNIGVNPENYNLLLIDSALHLHQGDVT